MIIISPKNLINIIAIFHWEQWLILKVYSYLQAFYMEEIIKCYLLDCKTNSKMKKISILGSTGSIGINALSVIDNHLNDFIVVALSAHKNGKL